MLTGCSVIQQVLGGGDATRDETGQVTEGNDNADIFLIRVGDCLNDANSGSEVSNVPIVPCAEPHDSEVFAELKLEDGEFPGDSAVEAEAEEYCAAEFTSFVGVDYDLSELYLTYYMPSKDTWEAMGDRLISCIVYDPAGQVEGTLAGAAR